MDILELLKEKAKEYGLTLTSGYRSPEKDKEVGGSGSGPHTRGEAFDFAGSWESMNKLADWAKGTGYFSQVIFKNKDYMSGRYIPDHMDHVHVGWKNSELIDNNADLTQDKRNVVLYAVLGVATFLFIFK